ncbi:MAG: DUF1294 domain-containing protein [Erysipelotrichaceae bacterium]
MELLILLVSINLISFLFFGYDKFRAIRHQWRVPESTLLFLSLFAPFGALIAMLTFRHKIRKWKFYLSVPSFACMQIVLLILFLMR